MNTPRSPQPNERPAAPESILLNTTTPECARRTPVLAASTFGKSAGPAGLILAANRLSAIFTPLSQRLRRRRLGRRLLPGFYSLPLFDCAIDSRLRSSESRLRSTVIDLVGFLGITQNSLEESHAIQPDAN